MGGMPRRLALFSCIVEATHPEVLSSVARQGAWGGPTRAHYCGTARTLHFVWRSHGPQSCMCGVHVRGGPCGLARCTLIDPNSERNVSLYLSSLVGDMWSSSRTV